MSDDKGEWCLIESDPGVFTELIRGYGVSGLQVEEVWSLDDGAISSLRPIYGLIFLFKFKANNDVEPEISTMESGVFFAQQVIPNACATQAIINLLLNIDCPDVKIGKMLTDYEEFCKYIDTASRGLVLSNCDEIRTIHNSFGRQTMFELDIRGEKSEDIYHFITYVPRHGKIWEMDGLRKFAKEVGSFKDGEDWIEKVKPIITEKIESYSEGEVHFNLMAVVADQKEKLARRIEELLSVEEITDEMSAEIANIQSMIEEEEIKMKNYRKENARRRHNYLPFLMEMLRILANENKLTPLIEQAKDVARERYQRNKREREAAKKPRLDTNQ